MLFAFLAALSMMLGLMRWPSLHWELAHAWTPASESDRAVLAAVFVLSGAGLFRHPRAPRWFSWWGIATGVLGLIGMWRNLTPAVGVVAALNNYLLPAWMIGFGA